MSYKERFQKMGKKLGASVRYEQQEGYREILINDMVIGTIHKPSNDIYRGQIIDTPPLAGASQGYEFIDCLEDMINKFINCKERGLLPQEINNAT